MSITIDRVYRRASLVETTSPNPIVPFRKGGIFTFGKMAQELDPSLPPEGMCAFSRDGVVLTIEIATFEKHGKNIKIGDPEGHQWTFRL